MKGIKNLEDRVAMCGMLVMAFMQDDKNMDGYEGILVCIERAQPTPFDGMGNIDDQCRICDADIKHRPIGEDQKLIPLCQPCGIIMATLSEKAEVKAMPDAEEEFDKIHGDGAAATALQRVKDQLEETRAFVQAGGETKH